jgi:hypothetical protein
LPIDFAGCSNNDECSRPPQFAPAIKEGVQCVPLPELLPAAARKEARAHAETHRKATLVLASSSVTTSSLTKEPP